MYSCCEDIGCGLLAGLSKSKHCRPLRDEAKTFVSSSINTQVVCLQMATSSKYTTGMTSVVECIKNPAVPVDMKNHLFWPLLGS